MEFNELKELLAKNRSYRRFDQSQKISDKELQEIAGLATLCASGRNLQPLKYKLVNDEALCAELFQHLAWAGYLTDWDGPVVGERPVAYIVQCLDENLTKNPMCDEGLQLEALTLGAVVKGYGTCIIKSFNLSKIVEILELDPSLKPTYVVALGVPKEEVVLEPMINGDIKYWRDDKGLHHVPKRGLEEILIK